MNNMDVAFFSAHIEPFAAHRKMYVCDAVYGAKIRVRRIIKRPKINFHLVVVPRRDAKKGALTSPSGTSNNAKRPESSSESSKNEAYRRLSLSLRRPRWRETRFGWQHMPILLRDGRERRRPVDPIWGKWKITFHDGWGFFRVEN